MQTFIKRFVSGESGVTAYGLVAAALMLIGVGAWVVATTPRVAASTQINPLEMMAAAKNLPGSLPAAQNAAVAVAQPPAAGAAHTAMVPGPSPQTSTVSHSGTKHDRKLHLSTKSTSKHTQLEPAPQINIP